jgi:hypothetical protein
MDWQQQFVGVVGFIRPQRPKKLLGFFIKTKTVKHSTLRLTVFM